MHPFYSVPFPMDSDPPHEDEGVITPVFAHNEEITNLCCPKPFMEQEKSITQINHTTRIKIAADFVDNRHQINTFSCKYLPPHMNVSSNTLPNSLKDKENTKTQIDQNSRIKIAAEYMDSSHQITKCSTPGDVCSDAHVCICMCDTCTDEIYPHMQVRSSRFSRTHSINIAAECVNSSHQLNTFTCRYLPHHMKISSITSLKSFMDQGTTKTQINHCSKIKIATNFVDSCHQINTFSSKYLPPHMQISLNTPSKSFMDQVNTKTQINHSSKIKIAADFVDSSLQINTFSSNYLPPHMQISS